MEGHKIIKNQSAQIMTVVHKSEVNPPISNVPTF